MGEPPDGDGDSVGCANVKTDPTAGVQVRTQGNKYGNDTDLPKGGASPAGPSTK